MKEILPHVGWCKMSSIHRRCSVEFTLWGVGFILQSVSWSVLWKHCRPPLRCKGRFLASLGVHVRSERCTPYALSFKSKHRLTPHLTSCTPPYTFNPFLNPPSKSTLKSLKTQKAPPNNQHNNPETQQPTKSKQQSRTQPKTQST